MSVWKRKDWLSIFGESYVVKLDLLEDVIFLFVYCEKVGYYKLNFNMKKNNSGYVYFLIYFILVWNGYGEIIYSWYLLLFNIWSGEKVSLKILLRLFWMMYICWKKLFGMSIIIVGMSIISEYWSVRNLWLMLLKDVILVNFRR